MGQAGSTGVKATVPAKTGKTQPRQTADIAVAAKTVKPTARTKGAIQSSTSGKVSTSMSTSARPGGTAASVALKGKTTTVAKSKVTEVESKQTPASASATKTGTARTNTAAKPAKAAA
ncbi:MAG: RNA polymerase sigma factor RpoD, partial [Pseudomonadota bacterium]